MSLPFLDYSPSVFNKLCVMKKPPIKTTNSVSGTLSQTPVRPNKADNNKTLPIKRTYPRIIATKNDSRGWAMAVINRLLTIFILEKKKLMKINGIPAAA